MDDINLYVPALVMITLTRIELKIELRPLIHPYQSDSGKIAIQDITYTARKGVRRRLSKEMADMGAGGDFDAATALPSSERQFQVLATPNPHLIIIAAQFKEIILVYRK